MIQIDWKPDKNSNVPIRTQIITYLTSKIRSNDWPVGTVLPTQRTLAEYFKVNRSTIVSALDELKADGIISGNGRGGTKVIDIPSFLGAASQPRWQHYIEDGIHIANDSTIKRINQSEPDESMLRLSSGEASPEMFSKDSMRIVLEEVAKDIGNMGYEWPRGMLGLREQLSEYLLTLGIRTNPKGILIVSGALQAIQLIAMSLLQPGSTVFVEKPSYIYSLQILQTLGMRRVGIPLDKDGMQAKLIPGFIKKNHASIIYTIPNFQNPTGATMSLERRNELLEICKKEKLPIIEDDVYGELWIDNPPPPSLKSLDRSGNVIYVGSVSKTLSPGLRIGWIVGPESVIDRLSDIKMQMDYGSSSIAQLTVEKWLETGLYQVHLNQMRHALKKRRDLTLQLLGVYFSGIASWNVPQGGYYVWVEMNGQINLHKMFEEAFKYKVLLYPGYIYQSHSSKAFRISYSYATDEELESGISQLSKIIRTLL
ncbi:MULTISPECIES: PLP-dependent aminotransferase family protein [unclassified Fusibacter]|uniref:MocR-like pyridoxine biosynthesis transcription factor PdxR n=1 Tax=unclassified Fusibacter TaxID=2624464 RepID=UPI0010137494|nr:MULTISPECIES: PLP-dependent aminotransferase family protein [unclassified Fusibacter]MCK8061602.1 PLP-dependent aminotransferase family protein [Fusibacter sp. A2]NPE23785.1 PLP-dependent aminotransferase family protein [Fusibacter sp. A1]RXV58690.1 PLP-dependent aminotransferase family protein [Fusibacter sp. A1]